MISPTYALAKSYLQSLPARLVTSTERDAFEYVPEFSRRGRSIPVYATLRHLGHRGVADLVERCCAHARQFAAVLALEPGIEILNDVVLNQVVLRFCDADAATRAVITLVQRDGTCWLGGNEDFRLQLVDDRRRRAPLHGSDSRSASKLSLIFALAARDYRRRSDTGRLPRR